MVGKENLLHLNDEHFHNEVLQSDLPVLVDFWAPWCGPCLSIAPAIEGLANEYSGRMKVGKMNVDESPKIPSKFGIMSIPTLILLKKERLLTRL